MLFPANVFASTPDVVSDKGNLAVESLDDYPEIGSPDADFAKGVRIGDAVYTITDENGNDPLKDVKFSSNAQITPQLFAAAGVTDVEAYPAYYEGGSYYWWWNKSMSRSWSQVQFRVDVYPSSYEYNDWVNVFNSQGKAWSHYRLKVTYKLDPNTIQYLIWDNGTAKTYGTPSGNYTLTVTTYPANGQYVGGGSYQSVTYQKADKSWANVGAAWVYNRTQ